MTEKLYRKMMTIKIGNETITTDQPVKIELAENVFIRITPDEDYPDSNGFRVMAATPLVIMPVVSNVVKIFMEKWKK